MVEQQFSTSYLKRNQHSPTDMPQKLIPFKLTVKEILAWVLIFLSPIAPVLWAIGFLIMADFFTGCWLAVHKGGWAAINSRAMTNTVNKMVLYTTAIIVSHVAELHIIPHIPWVSVCAGFIGMTEVKSIYENIGKVTGIDLWTHVVQLIKDKTKSKDNGSTIK